MNLFTRYRRWLVGPSAWYAKGLAPKLATIRDRGTSPVPSISNGRSC